jgi:predicted peptidase
MLLPLVGLLAGCPVTERQDTPVSEKRLADPGPKRPYWLYVPSDYSDQRSWPLVITLHGSHVWDDSRRQVLEWKYLAEQKGFIVVAPDLVAAEGILPKNEKTWPGDLASDEQAILAIIDELSQKYHIDANCVMLTGFSAGGYGMYYTGLRHPERFQMLIGRAVDSSMDIFENVPLTSQVRDMHIALFWGLDDVGPIRQESWDAVEWLSNHHFTHVQHKRIKGGHLRRPELAYELWKPLLPAEYRR